MLDLLVVFVQILYQFLSWFWAIHQFCLYFHIFVSVAYMSKSFWCSLNPEVPFWLIYFITKASVVMVANLSPLSFSLLFYLTFSSHKKSGSSSEESDGDVNPWLSVPTFSRTQSEPPPSHSHAPEGLAQSSLTSTLRSISQPYMH